MTIALFGSCRIVDTIKTNDCNHQITYPHCTKEVIQFIKFLNRDLEFPFPYSILCFRGGIEWGRQLRCEDVFNLSFLKSSAFVIEICSRKKYIHDNFYLHHTCIDSESVNIRKKTPTNIVDEHTLELQTDEEIEEDIMEIQKMLYPRKIVIVPHNNEKLNGKHIPARNDLINFWVHCAKNTTFHLSTPPRCCLLSHKNRLWIPTWDTTRIWENRNSLNTWTPI